MNSMQEVYTSEGYRKLGKLNFMGFYQKAITSLLKENLDIHDKDKILDAGCGYGIVSKSLEKILKDSEMSIDLYGFDISPSMPEAYKAYVDYPATLDCMDASSLDYENDYFDTIICAGLFEHIDEAEPVISEYIRCLKPNGTLIIVMSHKNIITQLLISSFGGAKGRSFSEFICFLNDKRIIKTNRAYFKGVNIWTNATNFAVKCKIE